MFQGIINAVKSLFRKSNNSTPSSSTSAPKTSKWNEDWTPDLEKMIEERLEIFKTATDLNRIKVGFHTLSKENQIIILREFIKAVCFYESGYNPKSQSVDVGTKSDKNTWSIGLMQISQVDQKSFNLGLSYTFEQLLEPIPNLHLALEILERQIMKTGKFILHKSDKFRYWAVILDEGKYSKLSEILAYTRNYSLEVPQVSTGADKIRDDLVELLKKDIGQRETNGKNRSPLIDAICKHFGLGLGNPYCIGWVLYRSDQYCKVMGFKNPLPKTMSTQEFYRQTPPAYKKPKGSKAKKADVGIQQSYSNASRGHAYVLTNDETTSQPTIEANTNPQGSRDGDGIYYNTRSQEGDLSKKYLGAVDIAQWIFDANFKA